MLEKYYFTKPDNTDLNMYRCGLEDCSPGHSWGPGVRDHYIIHYILGGKGVFHVNGNTYTLKQGDGFLICPDTVVSYQADLQKPWSYSWVGFHGIKAESYLKKAGLSINKPVFTYNRDTFIKDCLDNMLATKHLSKGREIRLLGQLYILLSQLIEVSQAASNDQVKKRREAYIKKAIEFIRMNYSRKISVSEISSHVNLDRSYLYSLFNEYLKVSPQEFMINYRISRACELMQNPNLSIGDVARSVGYEDPLLFSKTFKKVKGKSPREYKKDSL